MRHQVKIEELSEYINEHLVHFASSTKERKFFEVSLNGNFIISHYGQVVLTTNNIKEAVDKYNSLDKID